MNDPTYGMTRHLSSTGFDDALVRVNEALKSEGFGVLTSIDVKETLKKKLDVDFRRYVILGTCNPSLAHKSLQAEPFIGLLLPCNVVVMERDDGGSTVSIAHPREMFKVVENPDMGQMVGEVEAKLRRILERI
jgi:uncharacterized protein (DUF302 family)